MAFLISQNNGGIVPGLEYLPAGAITPKIGMALTMTDGNLAACGATTSVPRARGDALRHDLERCCKRGERGRPCDAQRRQHAGNGHYHERRGRGSFYGRHRHWRYRLRQVPGLINTRKEVIFYGWYQLHRGLGR